MSVADEATKVIGSIHFTLLAPSEIRRLSAVEIQTADTYDEDGVPIVSGLMDGRLGTLEPRQKCKTCGNTASACPGHFGHIELAQPVVHVAFAKLLHKLLQVTCRNCGRILLSADKIKSYNELMQKEQKQLNEVPSTFYEAVIKDAKKSQECPHCGARQYPIEHGKPTTFHEMIEVALHASTQARFAKGLNALLTKTFDYLGWSQLLHVQNG